MSTLDIFLEKGERIGIEKGIERGIEKGVEIGYDKALYKNTPNMLVKGFSLEMICEALEVTSEYVANVRSGLRSGE